MGGIRVSISAKLEEFLTGFWPARVMIVGTGIDLGETTASSDSDIGLGVYAKEPPFYQT
jgi:hypothetical protein